MQTDAEYFEDAGTGLTANEHKRTFLELSENTAMMGRAEANKIA
jgi:hypothetical protein